MNSHCFGTIALCAFLAGCGGGGGANEPTLEQGQVIPSDVMTNRQKVDFATAPSRYKAVLGWAQAVTLSKSQVGGTAALEMDYLRLVEETNPALGIVMPMAEASFDSPSLHLICILPGGRCDGALYERDPWYGSDSHVEMFNSTVANGTLQIDVSQTPNKVAHWWTPRVAETAPGRRYYLEARFRITGKAALQLGVDYWVDVGSSYNGPQNVGCTNGSNNCQAWASNWFGDTGGVFVTRKVPVF